MALKFVALLALLGSALSLETVIDGGRLFLETRININGPRLVVKLTAEGTGWVGFGISPMGGMEGADIVISGFKDGEAYFGDYKATGTFPPAMDAQQDVELISASENATHTVVEFQRLLDTMDTAEDIKIIDAPQHIIWAVGNTDEIVYHQSNRGTIEVNLMS